MESKEYSTNEAQKIEVGVEEEGEGRKWADRSEMLPTMKT
jgi:hypothetical protein